MRTEASPRLPPTSCADGGAAAAGINAINDRVLFAVGTVAISSVVMTRCCVTRVTSTSGLAPVTVSVSLRSPTFISPFTVAVKFEVSCTPAFVKVANPCSENDTV